MGLALFYLGQLPKFDGALEIGIGETAAQYPWNAETGDLDGWKADWIALNLDMTHEMHEKVAFRLFERTFRTVRAKHSEAKVMIVRAKPDGTDPEDEMWKRVVRFNFWGGTRSVASALAGDALGSGFNGVLTPWTPRLDFGAVRA